MAIINKLDNTAQITYNGNPVRSNTVTTIIGGLAPTIVKAVDKATANIGDTVSYTIVITNIGLTEIKNLPFSDVIPSGANYVTDSFKVNDVKITPTITTNTLTYTIPTIAALGLSTIKFDVTVVGGSSA